MGGSRSFQLLSGWAETKFSVVTLLTWASLSAFANAITVDVRVDAMVQRMSDTICPIVKGSILGTEHISRLAKQAGFFIRGDSLIS